MTWSDLLTDIKLRTLKHNSDFILFTLNKFKNIDKFQFNNEEENLLSSSYYFNEISEMFILYNITISSRFKLTFKIIYFTFIIY